MSSNQDRREFDVVVWGATGFTGALVAELQDEFSLELDASKMSMALYQAGKSNKLAFLAECSHIKRLQKLNIQKDIEFCLKENVYDVVPVLKETN